MFWIILVVIITIIFMVYWFKEEGFTSMLLAGILSFLVSALILLPAGLCFGDLLNDLTSEDAKTYYITEKTPIISLQDNSQVTGKFAIGCGYISEDLYYVYMTETESGYITNKIKADECFVKETKDNNPRLEEHTAYFNNRILSFITFGADKRNVLYVPEGTVIKEYQIDLS